MCNDNLVFNKSKSYLNFCTSIDVLKKPSPCLSTNLDYQVYFDRLDQFDPSIGLRDSMPNNSVNIHVYSI